MVAVGRGSEIKPWTKCFTRTSKSQQHPEKTQRQPIGCGLLSGPGLKNSMFDVRVTAGCKTHAQKIIRSQHDQINPTKSLPDLHNLQALSKRLSSCFDLAHRCTSWRWFSSTSDRLGLRGLQGGELVGSRGVDSEMVWYSLTDFGVGLWRTCCMTLWLVPRLDAIMPCESQAPKKFRHTNSVRLHVLGWKTVSIT